MVAQHAKSSSAQVWSRLVLESNLVHLRLEVIDAKWCRLTLQYKIY